VSFNAFVQRHGIGRRLRKDFGHLKTGRGVVYPMAAQMQLLLDASVAGARRVFDFEALAADPIFRHLAGGIVPSIDIIYDDLRRFEAADLEKLEALVAEQGLQPVRDAKLRELTVDVDTTVTPLFGEATPIIRFATGDRVRYLPAGSCHCGRTGGGIEAGTVSRYDSMVKIRGVNVWPEAVDEVVFSFPGVADYAAEVFTDETQGSEQVRLAVEFAAADPGERRRTLEALGPRLQERIGIRVEVVAHTGPALVAAVPDDWAKRSRWRDRRRTTQLS